VAGRTDRGAIAAIALAVTALVTTTVGAAALALPHTAFASAIGLASIHEQQATRLATTAAANADDRARARDTTLKSLRQAPANPTGWLRLAYLDSLEPAGLGPAGNRALAASWTVAPFGPDDSQWRLTFAFNHWAALDRANRLAALEELKISGRRVDSRQMLENVGDPSGRLALRLTLGEIRRARLAQTVQQP
jgi:hypothetical protein